MQNKNNWPLEHWHIEISGKCSLKCPRCTRQEVPGYVNTELNLEWFKNNFTFVDKVKKITFCGDDGDPIYAKDFLQVIEWLKQQNKNLQIVIVTNGSYKTVSWWQKLNSLLDKNDHIHFSLDGWDQKSNNLYRINCNWSSIIEGVKQIKNPYTTWAAIAFKFNENKIDHMKQSAKDLGFDLFQLTLSTKFGKNYDAYPKDDPLQPSDKFVATGRFKRMFTKLSNRTWQDKTFDTHLLRYKKENTENQSIVPLCMIGNKGLYINAEGKFYPCCWTGLRYEHNKNIFEYINFERTLPEILDDPMWKKLFLDLQFNKGPQECFEKCSAAKWNVDHATQW